MTTLAIAFLLVALALTEARRFGVVLNAWRGHAVARRLARLVPGAEPVDLLTRTAEYLIPVGRMLRSIDPTFGTFEKALRALGVARFSRIVGIELGKIVISISVALLALHVLTPIILKWIVPPIVYLALLFGQTELVRGAARNRRRRMLGELIFGIELITIFLEGGQSLDQALRSFCEVCGHALPRLEPIQRGLIADLNAGLAYEKALERWADNLTVEQARPLAALFTESLTHGTELVPQLRQFSTDIFEQRLLAVRASIGAKSAQLTVVMIAFFLPAILAFVAAPAVISLGVGLEAMK